MTGYKNWDSLKVKFLQEYWNLESDYRKFMLNEIIKINHIDPGIKMLDAGCGLGYLFKMLPDDIKENYTGIDFSQDMINYCREAYPEHSNKFKRVDILDRKNIPLSDLVVTQNVLQHITLYQMGLLNLVMRSRKAIILCERTKVKEEIKKYFKLIPWKMPRLVSRQNMNTEIVGYNPTRWRFNKDDFLELMIYLAKECGFQVPRVLGYPRTTDDLQNCLAVYYMDRGLTGK